MRPRVDLLIWIFNLCGVVLLSSQSIPNEFPKIGSGISYVNYSEQGGLEIDIIGRGLTWDLSYLEAPYQKEVSIEPASSGRLSTFFPNADIVLKQVNGYEEYFQLSGNNMLEVGRSSGFWALDEINSKIIYSVKPVIKRGGLVYGQNYNDNSEFSLEYGMEDYKNNMTMPTPGAFDSLRYDVKIEREISADGAGQLILPLSIHNVLKLKVEVTMTVTPYIKSPFGWRTYNPNSDPPLPSSIQTGIHRFKSYEFWSESHPLPVMVVEQLDRSFNVKYMVSDSKIPKISVYNKRKDILAFPNPTFGDIEIQLINLPAGNYQLEINNIFGQKLFSESYSVNHSRRIKTDLSFLSRGTYLYSIIDAKGNKISTKRVVIITP